MSKVTIIKDTVMAPYRNVCQLEVLRGRNRWFSSTGFFISPNVVLTAAHNVFSTPLSRVNAVTITPGRNKEEIPFGGIDLYGANCQSAIECFSQYRMGARPVVRKQFDVAVIVLKPDAIGSLVNWTYHSDFELAMSVNLMNEESLHIAGYPAYGELNPSFDGTVPVYDVAGSRGIDRNYIFHDLDTETGNSGSPVWVERNGKRIVVGVHTFDGGATMLNGRVGDWIQSVLRG
jgi:glutamyl endopeptidase